MNRKKQVLIIMGIFGVMAVIGAVLNVHAIFGRDEKSPFRDKEHFVKMFKIQGWEFVREPDISGPYRGSGGGMQFNRGSAISGSFTLKDGQRQKIYHEVEPDQESIVEFVENEAGEIDYFIFSKKVEKIEGN